MTRWLPGRCGRSPIPRRRARTSNDVLGAKPQDTGMSRFPTLARISQAADVDMGLDALFQCGLACFLDGLEAQGKTERP